jgi:DNA-binding response OmpR family regulator
MPGRILIVEDDEALGRQIELHLTRAGYEVTWWREGRTIEPEEARLFVLVILDLMLPGTYGMDVLTALRRHSEVPVLILSARIDAGDKVRGLKLGADDYMTKPFWPDELIERVRARLRRPSMSRTDLLELGPLRIDVENRSVLVQGKPVELTRVEFGLLAALAERPGRPVTREHLVAHVLDPARDGNERTLDVHMSRLRRKLGMTGLVETVWGIGYRLETAPGTES